MNRRSKALIGVAIISAGLWAFNTSRLAPKPDGTLTLMAHRGVHQAFDLTSVENDTCTASRMLPPAHAFMENTLPSMQAALDYGATMIELDIHPTTDGEFAVFHDWTLDCRTNGSGKVRDHTAADLKALDLGYGYTADGGQTYPFRGQFIGAMPMLSETLDAFPRTRFLINIKSRSKQEGRRLADYLERSNVSPERVVIYGHQDPVEAFKARAPNVTTMSKQQAKDCLMGYAATGWFGRLPDACKNTWVPVPENYRWLAWGWPNRFQQRLSSVGSEAVLVGPQTRARANPAIDTIEQLGSIPNDFGGTVWTNRIEIIGPALANSEE